jgi:hypothetical protein
MGQVLFGRPMQRWQSAVNAVAGEYDPATGEMRHGVVILSVPRRAGKSALVLAQLVRRVFGQARSRSWYTAQKGGDAGRTFRQEWLPTLRSSGLSKHLKISLRAGSESFELVGHGASATCFAPVEDALHGTNVDLAVVDEAWAHSAETGAGLELAVFPAQLTRPGSQTWIVSAGGTLESVWWDSWLFRAEQALAAGTPGIAIFDWGADPDAAGYDPRDPATWWAAHPALGDTIRPEAIAAELARSSDIAAFERSILNVWPRPRDLVGLAFSLERWAGLADVETAGPVTAIAFDVAGDRSYAAIATAANVGGRAVVEVADYRTGTVWVPDAVRALVRAHPGAPVVADALASGTIADRLGMAGIEVLRTGAAQMGRACADLVDQVNTGSIAHRAQAALDEALSIAGRRALGDGWAWSRRSSAGDISPLVAVTLAAWSARTRPTLPPPRITVATRR